MTASARPYLTAGIAALAASAVVIAPVQAPSPAPITPAAVRLSAAVQSLVPPAAAAAVVLGPADIVATAAPAGHRASQLSSVQAGVQTSVQANNAASNAIDSVYGVARYWANYVSLELGPWLLGFVPFGYLISDQIYIWYPTFTLPVVDSFVYDFLDPVVNDPLNPAVWANGLNAIATTAGNGLNSGITQEINYIVSLQWLPFPIPPLPPLPFAAAVAPAAAQAADLASSTEATAPAAPAEKARLSARRSLRPAPAAQTQDINSQLASAAEESTAAEPAAAVTALADATPDAASDGRQAAAQNSKSPARKAAAGTRAKTDNGAKASRAAQRKANRNHAG
ncbi:hypothetical protein B1R94_06835 [Mycolicibacterium litorale]|nr:hypothetical protein B1R94_06835 [Mycolicibacterium litorale]